MSPDIILLLAASALLVGLLIGSVGVGGVLLPPALAQFGGVDLQLAMATSMCAFLFTGLAGTLGYSRTGSIDWRSVCGLCTGAAPAAVAGALTNSALPEGALVLALSLILLVAGMNALKRREIPYTRSKLLLHPLMLVLFGAIVGFGSALTGTGGPVLLVPLLMLAQVTVRRAVGASQVIQVPIAGSAVAGYALSGSVDLALGCTLGLVAIVGVLVGSRIAHVLPVGALERLVGAFLVLTALLLASDYIRGVLLL